MTTDYSSYTMVRQSIFFLALFIVLYIYQSQVRKSQIWKFLGSFRNRQSTSFLVVLVRKSQNLQILWLIRKSQIRKFLQNTALLRLKTVIKVVFKNDFMHDFTILFMHKFKLEPHMPYL